MKYSYFIFLFLTLSTFILTEVNSLWCNETQIEQKVRQVTYEEVITKRKSTIMCRLRGMRDRPSCVINETVIKERPEFFNETVVVPKCCEGYELSVEKGCSMICNIYCQSGHCAAPNVCDSHLEPESAEYTTSKADVDYYDENDKETSTPAPAAAIENVTMMMMGEHSELISTSTEDNEGTENSTPATVVEDEGRPCSSGDCGTMNESRVGDGGGVGLPKRRTNWTLWVSVSAGLLTMCAVGFVIYVKLTRASRRSSNLSECGESVVSFSK